jgi:hypothetical protein
MSRGRFPYRGRSSASAIADWQVAWERSTRITFIKIVIRDA